MHFQTTITMGGGIALSLALAGAATPLVVSYPGTTANFAVGANVDMEQVVRRGAVRRETRDHSHEEEEKEEEHEEEEEEQYEYKRGDTNSEKEKEEEYEEKEKEEEEEEQKKKKEKGGKYTRSDDHDDENEDEDKDKDKGGKKGGAKGNCYPLKRGNGNDNNEPGQINMGFQGILLVKESRKIVNF
ncbi:hypothetical protein G7Y89_g5407 [Cudoniella acicularis]|uniref:Uncharacterized protein n=1 Tax=Cudoniella acicularis TaxID=354080 RepID=A0A8H4RMK1_9HELO|nr:hypothetical protein G7Y89_g5407 [Cudoniella acicularis]